MLAQPRRRLDRWAVVAIGREDVCRIELVAPGHGHQIHRKHDVDGLLHHDLSGCVSRGNGQQVVKHSAIDLYGQRVQVPLQLPHPLIRDCARFQPTQVG